MVKRQSKLFLFMNGKELIEIMSNDPEIKISVYDVNCDLSLKLGSKLLDLLEGIEGELHNLKF